jgi:hypothetical protein
MKIVSIFLLFSIIICNACNKSRIDKPAESSKSTVIEISAQPQPGPGASEPLTDEQLSAMGRTTGCQLAKLRRKDIFDNTVNSLDFPEAYKDGVRWGYTECTSYGAASTNSLNCETITDVTYGNGHGYDANGVIGSTLNFAIRQRQVCSASTSPIQ